MQCALVRSRRHVMSQQIRLRRAQDKRFQRTSDLTNADFIIPMSATAKQNQLQQLQLQQQQLLENSVENTFTETTFSNLNTTNKSSRPTSFSTTQDTIKFKSNDDAEDEDLIRIDEKQQEIIAIEAAEEKNDSNIKQKKILQVIMNEKNRLLTDDIKNLCYFCQKCKNHGLMIWKKVKKILIAINILKFTV